MPGKGDSEGKSTPMTKEEGKSTPMTKEAAARIQSAEAKQHGGGVSKEDFASRAQSSAAKNEQK